MKRTIYGISFIIGCLLIALIISVSRINDKIDSYKLSRGHIMPPAYLALTNKSENDLSLLYTKISPNRPPIANFLYKDKFCVKFVDYNLTTANNLKIGDIMQETSHDDHITYNKVYDQLSADDPFDIEYQLDVPEKISDYINLNVVGTTRAMVKNDSVAYYFLNCEKFFIKYDSGDVQDIYAETEGKVFLPIELMFLKRANHLFLIFMFGKDRSVELPVGSLDKLINSKGKLTPN